MHPLVLAAIIQAVFILGLSAASGFTIDFSDSDWNTALFLTPYGILHNLLTDSTLASFYGELNRGQTLSGLGPWWTYAYVFAQSCALELPVYCAFGLCRPWWRGVLFVFMMNSVTHPVVFFGLMNLPLTFLHSILVAETFAVVVETVALHRLLRMSLARAAAAAALANLVSWQVAPVLTYLVWG